MDPGGSEKRENGNGRSARTTHDDIKVLLCVVHIIPCRIQLANLVMAMIDNVVIELSSEFVTWGYISLHSPELSGRVLKLI